MEKPKLNCFLQSRAEVDACTQFLKDNNLVPHPLECKNFDMRMISPYLKDGDILDMGCIGSGILNNVAACNLTGLRYGLDLLFKPEDIDDSSGSWNNPNNPKVPGCMFFQGDLMETNFAREMFDQITCMSVIEHSVDFNKFAKECNRLLKMGGELFVTTDFWEPKPPTERVELYDLHWSILDKEDILALVAACKENGLEITSDIDWTTNEAVINGQFCSPSSVAYTFGVFHFIKK